MPLKVNEYIWALVLIAEESRFLDGMKEVHDVTMSCVVRFGKIILFCE